MLKSVCFAGFILVSLNYFCLAQTSDDTFRPGGQRAPTVRELQEIDFANRRRALESLNSLPRERVTKRTKPLTKAERKRIEELKTPSAIDLELYKDFLRQPKTGIFRIFPNFDCESNNLVKIGNECEKFVSGLWSYSFSEKTYGLSSGFYDLRFDDNIFVGGGFLNQGVLVSVGDLSLDSITNENESVKFLNEYNPETDYKKAVEQSAKIKKGISFENKNYSKTVRAMENNTYILRSISYRYKDLNKKRSLQLHNLTDEDRRFLFINEFKRRDLIVAFRVIRKSDDGGLTIIWKELKSEKSPILVYQPDDKLSEI